MPAQRYTVIHKTDVQRKAILSKTTYDAENLAKPDRYNHTVKG